MPITQPEVRRLVAKSVIELLANRGPEGVNLREVAQKADLSQDQLSPQAGNRAELLRLALDHILETFSQLRTKLYREAATPQQRLESFFLHQEKLLLEHTDLLTAWYAFVIMGRADKRVAARVQEEFVDRVETVRDFMKESMAAGVMRPDLRPGLTAEDLVGSVEGMGLLWLNRVDVAGIQAHRRRAMRRWIKLLELKT